MTGARRPAVRPKTGRVHLAPPAAASAAPPPPPPPPVTPVAPAPWWLPLATGVGSGLLAVAIGLLTAIHKLQLDAFTMAMLFVGVALAAGINAQVVLERPFGWLARVFAAAASAGKDKTP